MYSAQRDKWGIARKLTADRRHMVTWRDMRRLVGVRLRVVECIAERTWLIDPRGNSSRRQFGLNSSEASHLGAWMLAALFESCLEMSLETLVLHVIVPGKRMLQLVFRDLPSVA
jgi:hypothetical protein